MIAFVVVLVFFGVSSCMRMMNKTAKFDFKDVNLVQLEMPKDGQEIAIIETSEGTFKVALYRDYAPKTVDAFVKLANDGYYEGKYIFSIQDSVYFMAGSDKNDGTSAKGTATEKIDVEVSKDLWPLKGALLSYGPKGKTGGTYFIGVNSIEFTDEFKEEMLAVEGVNMDIVNAFFDVGGIPNFSQQFTVFAQTYEGMDVYDKIFALPVSDDEYKKPLTDVTIKTITISTYEAPEGSETSTTEDVEFSSKTTDSIA